MNQMNRSLVYFLILGANIVSLYGDAAQQAAPTAHLSGRVVFPPATFESNPDAPLPNPQFVRGSYTARGDRALQTGLRSIPVIGLCAVYNGMVTITDDDGLFSFPIVHNAGDTLTLVITPRIQGTSWPRRPTIIHHFAVRKKDPAAWYSLKRVKKEDGSLSWEITTIPAPKNNRIDPNTLVIFAEPNALFFDTPASQQPIVVGENIILPTLYARQTITTSLQMTRFISIGRYFMPVRRFFRTTATHAANMVA